MSETQKKLTDDQIQQLNELILTYGIEADDVVYFNDQPEPFFSFDATALLCNELTDLEDINIEPFPSVFQDSIAMKCTVVTADRSRSAVGVANLSETINGDKLNDSQKVGLASARAIRNALKLAGIDLLKAHYRAKERGEVTSITATAIDCNRSSLLAQAHILGGQSGLIQGQDKTLWRNLLARRYEGIESSKDLSNAQISDLIAFLNSLLGNFAQVAA